MAISLRAGFLGVLGVLVSWPLTAAASDPVRLREDFPPGYQYHVSSRTELSGALSLPPDQGKTGSRKLTVAGSSAIDYDERILAVGKDGQVQKTARIYRRMEFRRTVGDRPQESTIRPGVRRLVILRLKQVGVPFSPDGSLTWGEIDLVRTDVFTPALAGLLPARAVQPGDHWTAADAAIEGLTGLERIEEGKIECRLQEFTTLDRRQYARVALAGSVRGVNEDGPNRQKLDGYFFFDLQAHHLGYLYLKGISTLLDKDGKEVGSVEGRFVLTRQVNHRSQDLSDEALKGVTLEPNDDNTLLLYDNPELGIKFLYPRRWRVAGERGRQVAVDEANGSGLLITLEAPGQAPTAAQFLNEARDWLRQRKAKMFRIERPRRLQGPPRQLDQFALDVEVAGQRSLLDYYVFQQTAGGGTLTARLLPADQAVLRQEVQRMARSIVLRQAGNAEPKK